MKNPESLDERELGVALASLDGEAGEEPDLPDPAILWRKARLLESLEARRNVARPVRFAHGISLALTAGVLAVVAGTKGVSLFGWTETVSSGLALPLTLSLFVLGAALFLATGAAAGRNLSRRAGGSATD